MILILLVSLALLGLEKVIASDQLENCARERPHICRLVVIRPDEDLWGTILPGLDNVRELVIDVAAVAHVDNLDSELHIYHLFHVFLIKRLDLIVPTFIRP